MDPIVIGHSEITSIDYTNKLIGLLVHHSFSKEERFTKHAGAMFLNQKSAAVRYLTGEGFIDRNYILQWHVNINGMYHPPTKHYG